MSETQPTDGEKAKSEVITVKLAPQDGSSDIEIRARQTTKIQKLVDAWAKQRNVSSSSVRLLSPEGERLQFDWTLQQAGIRDGDQIDVMLIQTGGGKA
ncbi:Ubiquitinlike protein [Balamuthia mandrillaris]